MKAAAGTMATTTAYLNLDPAVDRLSSSEKAMGNHSGALFLHHPLGEHATHPIAPLPSRLALLLLVAGLALRPRRA
jgi:hypothetical protein